MGRAATEYAKEPGFTTSTHANVRGCPRAQHGLEQKRRSGRGPAALGCPAPASRSTPPRRGPRTPLRSAPRHREAWPAARTLVAAMASVVEYKGLKAGYHCGYCDSEEGKVSYGECSH